jgi:hypothetical protein
MITGSMASSLQGEPRATHDIDVVVAIDAPAETVLAALRAAFPEPDFYLDPGAVRDAIVSKGMFNVIDTREGDKIDCCDEPGAPTSPQGRGAPSSVASSSGCGERRRASSRVISLSR